MKPEILITGGSGFIGSNLTVELIKQGYNIVDLSKHKSAIQGIKTLKLDLTKDDLSLLDDYKFDYVIHLAAISSIKNAQGNEEETIKINLEGTKKILKYFSNKNLKKLIFLSSVTVYQEVDTELTENSKYIVDKSANVYSYSKFLAENECGKYENKIPIIIFRLANAYGPLQRVGKTPNLIPQIIYQALKDKKIEVGNGKFARDFIYVSDIVAAIIAGLKSDFRGTLNLGTGKPTKVEDIAKIVKNELKVEFKDLKRKISSPLELTPNITLIKDILKWKPKVGLKEGMVKTIKYYKTEFENGRL